MKMIDILLYIKLWKSLVSMKNTDIDKCVWVCCTEHHGLFLFLKNTVIKKRLGIVVFLNRNTCTFMKLSSYPLRLDKHLPGVFQL